LEGIEFPERRLPDLVSRGQGAEETPHLRNLDTAHTFTLL
jgi:hypothetical protein